MAALLPRARRRPRWPRQLRVRPRGRRPAGHALWTRAGLQMAALLRRAHRRPRWPRRLRPQPPGRRPAGQALRTLAGSPPHRCRNSDSASVVSTPPTGTRLARTSAPCHRAATCNPRSPSPMVSPTSRAELWSAAVNRAHVSFRRDLFQASRGLLTVRVARVPRRAHRKPMRSGLPRWRLRRRGPTRRARAAPAAPARGPTCR
mmetsp:Transcript_26316/g.75904  ORF Transcript_26316/g.75904 Transcript_26316/m.75904 type:complete len:203 (+) Transcript_26316:1128-1736(+)